MCERGPNARIRLLVTGFGPFPGAPRNPSATVVAALARHRASFARRGVTLTLRTLPVLYAMTDTFRPEPGTDFVVAIGVAGRRKRVCVETIARRRRSPRHPDASGRFPNKIRNGAREVLRVDPRWNAPVLAMALAKAGVPTRTSRDAGLYVCNALLYRVLEDGCAPALFIHIPSARVCSPQWIAAALARTLPDAVARFARRAWRNIPI